MKPQIPITSPQRLIKLQNPIATPAALVLGTSLGFGDWDLGLSLTLNSQPPTLN